MVDIVRDIILAIAGILVLFVLNRANTTNNRVPPGVWPLILVGFLLLLFGRVMEMVPHDALMMPPLSKIIMQEVLGFCLGFVMLMTGLVRWLPEMTGRRQQRNTNAPVPDELQPARSELGAQTMLASVLKSSLSGVMVLKSVREEGTTDIIDFEVELMNEAAQQILGRSMRSMYGRNILKEFPCIARENLLGHMISVIETGLPYRDERRFNHDRDRRWYQFVAVKQSDGLTVTFADVSARKRAEDQLRHAAHHDTLTGLPNRALFTERLTHAISRSKRFADYKFAVLFLDFDRFKVINDTLGHEAGDQLLIGIAERLRSNLRTIDTSSRIDDDTHLPARLGGDEFVILLENIREVHDAVCVAERLQAELAVPHLLQGHEMVSTASIGIVTSDLGYDSADDIIRDADVAMYQAKIAGKARHVVFDERMHREVAERANLERELREAAENLPFELLYDPVVELETGRLVALDAVASWPHPTRGRIGPAEFMGLAEEIGIALPIGEWLLRSACTQVAKWHKQFPDRRTLSVNANLSRQSFQHPDFIPTLQRVLADSGLHPGALRLGITETMLGKDARSGGVGDAAVFGRLKEIGVQLVLSDFGSGQSSLGCLHRFPIDHLRIDHQLVSIAPTQRNYGAIVNAVVELAHNLDIKVIAAGVADHEQLAMLQALNCDYGQGPAFSEPVTSEECEKLLERSAPFSQAA